MNVFEFIRLYCQNDYVYMLTKGFKTPSSDESVRDFVIRAVNFLTEKNFSNSSTSIAKLYTAYNDFDLKQRGVYSITNSNTSEVEETNIDDEEDEDDEAPYTLAEQKSTGLRQQIRKQGNNNFTASIGKHSIDYFTISDMANSLAKNYSAPVDKTQPSYLNIWDAPPPPPFFTSNEKKSVKPEVLENERFAGIMDTIRINSCYFKVNRYDFTTELGLSLNSNFLTNNKKYIKIVKEGDNYNLHLINSKDYSNRDDSKVGLNYLVHLFFDLEIPTKTRDTYHDDFTGSLIPFKRGERYSFVINKELSEQKGRAICTFIVDNQEYNIQRDNIHDSYFQIKEQLAQLILNYKYPKNKRITPGCEVLFKDEKLKVLEVYDHSPNLFLVENEKKESKVIKRTKKNQIVKL